MVADLFHAGHVAFLRKARALGDRLLVGIHSDETVASYKRRPVLTMEERMAVVEGCRYVDEVIADAPLTIDRRWLDRHGIDLVVHGDDLDDALLTLMYAVPKKLGKLRLEQYTPGISK
jgi:cytidyltransferase-like protein